MQTMDTQPARGGNTGGMLGARPPATSPTPPAGQTAGQNPVQTGQSPQALNGQQLKQMQIMSRQAMTLLLKDDSAQALVQQAQAGEPAQVVAGVVVKVLGALYQAASGAGQQVDMVTLMVTGVQIIGTIAEMLAAAGVLQEQQLPQFVAQASKLAIEQHNASIQQGGA